MPARLPNRHAYTLAEMLAVVVIVAVLAWSLVPNMTPGTAQQLLGAAEVLAGDLAMARSLAVANSTSYRVTIDVTQNRYVLEHTGTNTALDTLPTWAFRSPGDPADQHIVQLAQLPNVGLSPPALLGVTAGGTSTTSAWVEFTALGATSISQETVIWLQGGSGATANYLSVRVNPVTGLATVGNVTDSAPAGITLGGGASPP